MIIDLKKETQEVREWFRDAQAATGLSGRALVIGAIMDFRQKAKERTLQPRKKEPRTQEAGGMKYGPIETILATPAMKEELQQKGRIEVLCSEGFQTLRAVKEQTPFWMDGIYVRVIARNERATVVLLEEECVSVPSTGSDVGTKSVHLQ